MRIHSTYCPLIYVYIVTIICDQTLENKPTIVMLNYYYLIDDNALTDTVPEILIRKIHIDHIQYKTSGPPGASTTIKLLKLYLKLALVSS